MSALKGHCVQAVVLDAGEDEEAEYEGVELATKKQKLRKTQTNSKAQDKKCKNTKPTKHNAKAAKAEKKKAPAQ